MNCGNRLPAFLRCDELVGLLDHRQVGGEAGVVDLVEAEGLQSAAAMRPVSMLPGCHAEGFAQGHAYRRRDLCDDRLLRIVEGFPDVFDLAARRQRAGRANRRRTARS